MDIQSLKTMLEIQALQSLGSQQSSSVDSLLTSDSSMFSDMIQELLTSVSSTTTDTTDLNTLLGSASSSTNVSSLLSNLTDSNELSSILGSAQSKQSNTAQSYLATMLYSGSNNPYIPSYLNKSNYGADSSTVNTLLDQYKQDFTGATSYSNLLAGANQYSTIIKKASTTYGIPEKLIASVMKKESNFNSSAVSPAGAVGLMQLMPGTAKYLGVEDSLNPEQNVMGGAKYLRQMLDKFDNNVSLALAAYNAGPGNVKKYDGIPPFKETTNYVSKVLKYLQA